MTDLNFFVQLVLQFVMNVHVFTVFFAVFAVIHVYVPRNYKSGPGSFGVFILLLGLNCFVIVIKEGFKKTRVLYIQS